MGKLWTPRAERANGPGHAGNSMVGGPPRVVHHITWDSLSPRPSYDATRNYLIAKGFEPTLMIDPLTGRMTQFLPASRAAYALRNAKGGVETNRMGDVCIQVEWFFSPGLTVKGVRYDDLTETPLRGLEELLDLAASWGVPQVWPAGVPAWRGNARPVRTWLTEAGHYGHCHVPENTHTDPGPMLLSRRLPPAPVHKPQPSHPTPEATQTPLLEEDDVARRIKKALDPQQYLVTWSGGAVPIQDQVELGAWKAAGFELPPLEVLADVQVDALVAAAQVRR